MRPLKCKQLAESTQKRKRASTAHHSQLGMTLIEMMVVVVILSILTTLGITGYKKLVYQARNAEAYQFLGSVRAAQNTYYQAFGQYAGNQEWAEWPQGPFAVESRIDWGEIAQDRVWQSLGARPEGPVWFKYRIRASIDPSQAPAAVFRPRPAGPWFQVQARGDFNGDGTTSLFEITSARAEVFAENMNE